MPTPTTFKELVKGFSDIFNLAIGLIIAVVFLLLVWKIFDAWVINAADEKKREEGKQIAIVAIVVLVVVLSIWGIVRMIQLSIFG